MGRDIYVESKHFDYYGSKSSDLIMAFDRFFCKFPKYTNGEATYYDTKLSRKEMKQALEFVKDDILSNRKFYRNADELLEKMNNIYIRMMPNDFVEVWTC